MAQKILITSALPYANGPLHFGHIAGAYLPGDCHARYQRLKGRDVLYVCGSDEYGIAITLSAEMAGRTPQQQVDLYHQINTDFFRRLNFSFDNYSRTTWGGHIEPVQQFFTELLENGYIEERITDQLFSEKENRYLADRYVVGECPSCGFDPARGDECPKCGASYDAIQLKNPRSKLTGSQLTLKKTKHWFLLLEKFQKPLLEWIEGKQWKPNVVNFIKGYINNLHARAITRDMTWGVPIPLPDTQGKVLYVWFDAPIGYISASIEWAQKQGQPDLWKKYWCDPETKLINFLGKDNIPFHAAIFPAMIMGQNQPYKLVDDLPANEFYNLEGHKFSKSEGWTIDLDDFFSKYTADQIRYAIAANAPETTDSEFTWRDFQTRCNAELLGKYGNLVNRTMVFAAKQCEGKIPPLGELEEEDKVFLERMKILVSQVEDCFAAYRLRAACRTIMEIAQEGNAYFDARRPWVLAKENRQQMMITIRCCLECLKVLALVSSPIIPETSQKVWAMLGMPGALSQESWDSAIATELPEGQILGKPEILFRKIEDEAIDKELKKLEEMTKKSKTAGEIELEPLKPSISFDDFTKLDLRVGKIVAAEAVPKSKKLLKIQVDIGFETRTVVSGIGQFYTPDELVGKSVIVVINLEPAKLMGIESQGMILAGSVGDLLELPDAETLPPGSVVS